MIQNITPPPIFALALFSLLKPQGQPNATKLKKLNKMHALIMMSNENFWELHGFERRKQLRRAQTTAFYLNLKQEDVTLDLGCGEGFVTSCLAGSLVLGLDISKNALLIAKQKVSNSNTDFICADAAYLPLKEASFNKATLLELLEHLPKEAQKKVCTEVDRTLKQEGIMLVSVPYKENLHGGKLAPLGHLHSMDEEKVTNLLPKYYTLVASCHLPNLGLISLAKIFQSLSLRLWLFLNTALGKFRKGYWLLLKYKKMGDSYDRA